MARFAVPILAEQAQVVALARSLVFAKPRLGESGLPLGESVALNLAERGLSVPEDLFDPAWTTFQLHGSVWTVRFRHEARGRLNEALWELDVATSKLIARNRVASDLGYVDPSGRRTGESRGSSDARSRDGHESADDHDGASPGPATRTRPAARPAAKVARNDAGRPARMGSAGTSAPVPTVPRRPGTAGRTSAAGSRGGTAAPIGRSGNRAPTRRSATASDDKGDGGPPVRGAGVRAATAQVTSAHVAASRTIVARSVPSGGRPPSLSTSSSGPRPSPDRSVSPDHSVSADRPVSGNRSVSSDRSARDEHSSSSSASSSSASRDSGESTMAMPAPPRSRPQKSRGRPASPPSDYDYDPEFAGVDPPDVYSRGLSPVDDADNSEQLPTFRPRTLPVPEDGGSGGSRPAGARSVGSRMGASALPSSSSDRSPVQSSRASITRVRPSEPLVRRPLPISADVGRPRDLGRSSEGSDSIDQREPVRVPAAFTPTPGPDLGRPGARQRVRRLRLRPR